MSDYLEFDDSIISEMNKKEPHIIGRELIIPWGKMTVKITKITGGDVKLSDLKLHELVFIPGIGIVRQDLGTPIKNKNYYTIEQYFKDPDFWTTSEEAENLSKGENNESNDK